MIHILTAWWYLSQVFIRLPSPRFFFKSLHLSSVFVVDKQSKWQKLIELKSLLTIIVNSNPIFFLQKTYLQPFLHLSKKKVFLKLYKKCYDMIQNIMRGIYCLNSSIRPSIYLSIYLFDHQYTSKELYRIRDKGSK